MNQIEILYPNNTLHEDLDHMAGLFSNEFKSLIAIKLHSLKFYNDNYALEELYIKPKTDQETLLKSKTFGKSTVQRIVQIYGTGIFIETGNTFYLVWETCSLFSKDLWTLQDFEKVFNVLCGWIKNRGYMKLPCIWTDRKFNGKKMYVILNKDWIPPFDCCIL